MSEKTTSAREHYPISDTLQFALSYAMEAGLFMVEQRNSLVVSKKLDRTDVSNVDTAVNYDFEQRVEWQSNGRASVIGEESSRLVQNSSERWIIDPVDGTGEYIDDTIADHERTSCVGIAFEKDEELQLAVIRNPFRDELFYAGKELGGAFLNGQRLDLTAARQFLPQAGIPYDYCHWDGAVIDARFFEAMIGSPIGSYSAIYQACMVAKGESAFAVFPGNTLHDIAPATVLVEMAGGVATDPWGRPIDPRNLCGAVYSNNPTIHIEVLRALESGR